MEFPSRLLDKLGGLSASGWSGRVYRWVFEGTPPDRANVRGARWNPPEVEALYTGLSRDVVIAESDYLILAQGIAPTRSRKLYTLQVSLASVLQITDPALLQQLGVDDAALRSTDHGKCQLVGGAVERLGHDGLIVPSARGPAHNVVIFVRRLPFGVVPEVVAEQLIDV